MRPMAWMTNARAKMAGEKNRVGEGRRNGSGGKEGKTQRSTNIDIVSEHSG